MDFELSERARALRDRVEAFFESEILPRDREWHEAVGKDGVREAAFLAGLRQKARAAGLWNMALPRLAPDDPGCRLTNLEFAPLAEIMGRLVWAPAVFNCHAPDVPNMEILQMFATPGQKARWLRPLLEGTIRSAFAMTEPAVASSDASNIATEIRRTHDGYVVSGRKWFVTAGSHPECRFLLVVGVTDPSAERSRRHSIVIVPSDAPGLRVVRELAVFDHYDGLAPHAELELREVRIPRENLLGAEGAGFAIGQARLGPARIHHCMRAIGTCEVLVDLMLDRAARRETFGRKLVEYSTVQEWVALSRLEIEAARLLVQKTAWLLDRAGGKAARQEVSLIKIGVARAFQNIADRAVQVFGAMGTTSDTPVARAYGRARALRIYDGPDEVHYRTIFRLEQAARRGRNDTLAAYYHRDPTGSAGERA
ncbi:MAG: acyl-CoA dehydrogenase family protein [Alphaproteobacteria bacterium]|nr:acyl-CoA dehydrogenase family protein [Alphaproteobacteria bacterium]